MLGQDAILHTENIHGDPIRSVAARAEAAVKNDPFALREYQSVFVTQRGWRAFDQVEQTFPAGCDVRAVLNVVRRPKLFGRRVVALVEKRIEGLQNQLLVSFLNGLSHVACFLVSGIHSAVDGKIRSGNVGRLRSGNKSYQRSDLIDTHGVAEWNSDIFVILLRWRRREI